MVFESSELFHLMYLSFTSDQLRQSQSLGAIRPVNSLIIFSSSCSSIPSRYVYIFAHFSIDSRHFLLTSCQFSSFISSSALYIFLIELKTLIAMRSSKLPAHSPLDSASILNPSAIPGSA